MSLYIEVDDVASVLLADGWHHVQNRSFEIDSYEFHHAEAPRLLSGDCKGVCPAGAVWTEMDGAIVCCPVTAILAVRSKRLDSRKVAPGAIVSPRVDI